MRRRTFAATVSGLITAGVAGCTGGLGEDEEEDDVPRGPLEFHRGLTVENLDEEEAYTVEVELIKHEGGNDVEFFSEEFDLEPNGTHEEVEDEEEEGEPLYVVEVEDFVTVKGDYTLTATVGDPDDGGTQEELEWQVDDGAGNALVLVSEDGQLTLSGDDE